MPPDTAEPPSLGPVFKDTIKPEDSPIGQAHGTRINPSPDAAQALERSIAVSDRYAARAGLAGLGQHINTQPTVTQITGAVETAQVATTSAEAAVANANQQLTAANALKGRSGPFGGIIRAIGGGGVPGEKAQKVQDAATAVTGAQESLAAAQAKQEEVQTYAKANMLDAARYSPDYLARESKPERILEMQKANQIATDRGPLTATESLKEALKRQDELADVAKYYQEIKSPEFPQEARLSRQLITEIDRRVRETKESSYTGRTPEDRVKDAIVTATAMHEAITGYADREGLQVDRQKLFDSLQAGMGMWGYSDLEGSTDEAASKKRVDKLRGFVADKLNLSDGERDALFTGSRSAPDSYVIASTALYRLFIRQGLPEDPTSIPYVLEFYAGAVALERNWDLVNAARDSVTDLLPVASTKTVRRKGEWVDETADPAPRGIGAGLTRPGWDPRSVFSVYDMEMRNALNPKDVNEINTGIVDASNQAADVIRFIESFANEASSNTLRNGERGARIWGQLYSEGGQSLDQTWREAQESFDKSRKK